MSILTEGLVALGHDVTLFATADSLTSARLHADGTARLRGRPGPRRQGVRGPAHRGRVRAGRRVRPAPQPLRLPAADLQPAGRHAGRDHHPRLLVGADRAGLPRYDDIAALRRDQRRRPAPEPDLRRDDPPRHRPRPRSRSGPARRLPAVLRPHPSGQGRRPRRSSVARGPACRWSSPASSRTRSTSSVASSRTSTATASATSAPSDPPSAGRCWAARAHCCT